MKDITVKLGLNTPSNNKPNIVLNKGPIEKDFFFNCYKK